MKFVFYKQGKKYTINNAAVGDLNTFKQFIDEEMRQVVMNDSQLMQFQITSIRSAVENKEQYCNQEIIKEAREGINWGQETVN